MAAIMHYVPLAGFVRMRASGLCFFIRERRLQAMPGFRVELHLLDRENVFMRKIIVVPYDDRWPDMFEAESLLIKTLLGGIAKDVHHIGSTSVPGLSAKPVIDILLGVSDINELDKYHSAMAHAGYVARGENGIAGRRYFIKGGDQRSHQVHAFAVGDMQVLRHLAFRDYLRRNKDIAEEYAEIKHAAALLSRNDAHRYSALKAKFIERHLQLALAV